MRALVLTLFLVGLAACADPYIESTTVLESGSDTVGPYQVQSVVIGSFDSDSVDLMYNPVDAKPHRYIPVRMHALDEDLRAGELFEAGIPGQPVGTTIRYYVRVLRDGEHVAESPPFGDLRPFILDILP